MKLKNIEKLEVLSSKLRSLNTVIDELKHIIRLLGSNYDPYKHGTHTSGYSYTLHVSKNCLSRVKEIIISDLNDQREKVIKEIEELD